MKVFRFLYEIKLYQIKNTIINESKSYSLPVTFYFLHHEWFESFLGLQSHLPTLVLSTTTPGTGTGTMRTLKHNNNNNII